MDALVYPSIPVATEEPKSLLETVNALKHTMELLTGTGDRGKVQRPTDRNVIHTFVQDTQPQAWNVGDLWLCKYPKVTLSCWDGKVWVLLLETIAATVPPGTGPAGPPGPPGPPGASGVGYGVDATVLDFINGSYDESGTVTLASALNVIRASIGIVPNADGTWTEMVANVARRGVGTGLLIEAGSTNRLLWCHDPSNAVWTKNNLALSAAPSGPVASRGNGTRVTATGNNAYLAQTYTTTTGVSFTATIAGDQMTVSAVSLGVLGATQIITGAGVLANTEIVLQVSGVGGVRGGPGVYTLNNSQTVSTPTVMNVVYNRVPSLLIQRAVGTGPIYLSQDGGVTQTDISDQLITGKWVQAYTPYDARVSPQWRLTIATYGDAVDVDYAQLEDKTYPSSPIFTTSAQASRSTDEVYLNLATFPAFINSDKLTVLEVAKPLNENVHTSGYLDQDIWTWLTIQGFDATPVGTVTGSIASTATMTVTAATVGLKLYQGLTGGGTPVLPDTTLFAQFSGTPGGAGVWSVLPIQTTPSQTMNVVPNHAYFCNATVKPVTNRRNVGVTVVNTTTTRNYYGFDPQTQEYAYRRWNRLGFSTTASLKQGIVALNGDVEHSQAPFNDAWPDASKFDTVVLGGQMPGAVNSLNGFIAQLVIMPDQAWTAQQLADWTSDDVDTPPTWAEITDKPSTFPPTMPLGIYIATDYGIVGNGTTNNAVTLQSLIDAVFAAGGGTIKLPRGVYRLDAQIRLKDKVYLQGEGPGLSMLDFSQKSFYQNPGNGSGGLAGPYGACIFQTGGSTSNQVSVTANVVEGAVQIAVSSITGFNPGDWIIIRTTLQEGAAGKIADICHVEWADSGFIYIQQPVAHNYLIGSGTVSVVKLNTVTSGVSDLTVKGKGVNPASMPSPPYTGIPPGDAPNPALTYDQRGDDGIEFRYGKDCFVDNVAFVGVEGVCTLFSVSIGTKVTRSVFTFDSIHCFPQYGVYPQTANINTWIEGNKFYNGRHHISTGYVNATSQDYYFGSPNGIVITKNHCFGSWVYPIDSHEAAVNIVITDNIIEGLSGGIEVRGKWVTVTGNIISLPTPAQGIPGISEGFGIAVRMAQENITISTNRIVGGSIGIYFGAVTTGPNTRVVVANNVINRSFSACIQLDAGMDNFAITGNVGQVLSGGANSNVIYVNGCKGGSITGNTCIIDQPAPLFASGIRMNSTAVGDTTRVMISSNAVIDKGSGGTTTGIQIDLDSTEVIIGHNNVSSCTNPISPAATTGSITVASLSSDLKGRTLTLAQGTITAAERMIEAQSTWNNVAVTFTGFYQNITDTASAAGSYLLDLRVGGSTKFSVSKIGTIGVGVAQTTAMSIRNSAPLTGGAGAYGYYNDGQVQSDVTSAVYNRLHVSSAAGTTGTSIWGYWVSQGTLTGPITTQYGFYADANFKDATTSYGFYGNLAAGTGKWNFYAAGTAANYLGGTLSLGALTVAGFTLRNSLNMVGSSGVTRAFYAGGTIQSDVTSSASYFEAAASTQAAAFTLPSLYYYLATQGNITGGGSAVTAQYGFYASANMVGAGTNYAYYSGLPAAANNWAFYSVGTAESYTRGGWTTFGNTAIPAGGTAGTGYKFSSTANYGVFFGSGAPTLAAAKGSLYLRSDGSTTNDRAYINTNGSTTWTALTTAA